MSVQSRELSGIDLHAKVWDISERFSQAVEKASERAGSDSGHFFVCLKEEIENEFSLEEIMCIRRYVNAETDSITGILVTNDIRRIHFIKLVTSIINRS